MWIAPAKIYLHLLLFTVHKFLQRQLFGMKLGSRAETLKHLYRYLHSFATSAQRTIQQHAINCEYCRHYWKYGRRGNSLPRPCFCTNLESPDAMKHTKHFVGQCSKRQKVVIDFPSPAIGVALFAHQILATRISDLISKVFRMAWSATLCVNNYRMQKIECVEI